MQKIIAKAALAASVSIFPLQGSAQDWGSTAEVLTVDQGWDEIARNTFYHAPQGSPIMPYDFFLALEQPTSDALFRDETFLRSLGMLYWGESDLNPDGLPIGLTVDKDVHGVETQLGMNCAACHVTEIKVGDKTALVDGGVSHFDFYAFMNSLLAALEATYSDRAKFDRFAKRVLGEDYNDDSKSELYARLRGVKRMREDWAVRNAVPQQPGPGRVDALNVILNQVSAMMLNRPDNARSVDAPVSYPFLWDAPYLSLVQYNGVVPNRGAGALGRNVGQVLGVFGEVSINESIVPGGYASSVRVDHLMDLEDTLHTLTSPQWSDFADLGLLPPIDTDLAMQGAKVYAKECASCHQVIDPKNRGDLASIDIPLFDLETIGTDPLAAMGFSARLVSSGPLEGRKSGYVQGDPMCEYVHAGQILAHVTVGVIMHDLGTTYKSILSTMGEEIENGLKGEMSKLANGVKSLFGYGNKTEQKRQETDQQLITRMNAAGASEDEIIAALKARSSNKAALYEVMVRDGLSHNGEDAACLEKLDTAQYRARPLNGIWATGPFLHNGSVPTLEDLLMPQDQRPTTFRVGDSVLDPKAVGFVEPEDGFVLDTTKAGNANSGHSYGTTLSDVDKAALIEYLKTL